MPPGRDSGWTARSPETRWRLRTKRRPRQIARSALVLTSRIAHRSFDLRTAPERRNEAASPPAIYTQLGLDSVSEGIAVGVFAHEARVDDVGGLSGESRDAARRTDRCSPDVGVFALAHARHHPRRARSASTCLNGTVTADTPLSFEGGD